jgi:7-carboxy-7-deazaguanine synthase
MSDTIRISEIFGPTIQGEGALIGQPTVFVRTGGCDYRCTWCDTMHAVDSKYRADWQPMTAAEIFARVKELSGNKPIMVTLSGGNPAIQLLGELITLGKSHSYRFAIETQGSVAQDWFRDLDMLVLSPKPPSSQMETDFKKLDECVAVGAEKTVLKFVVFDDADYDYAKSVAARYPNLPVYLQPGNHAVTGQSDMDGIMARMHWLIEKTIQDKWYAATVLPQLHVLLWGNQRGV